MLLIALTALCVCDTNAKSSVNHISSTKRQLSNDVLECNLQIYHDFIESQAGSNIFVMATMCESRIISLKTSRAGGYGPIDLPSLKSAMCSSECLKSDELHQLAMAKSRCTCSQVSANTSVVHDFCLENSARLLCTHLSECGHWNCALEDFMCLRYEWDRSNPCGSIQLAISGIVIAISVWTMVLMS